MEIPPSEMSEEQFVARFGGVYEHSPWIAREAWRAGLQADQDEPSKLAALMASIVDASDADDKLALIRAHPDLAGRAAVAGELTQESRTEQAGAGIDRCTVEEFNQFQDLNESYKRKFGFPFIMAVKGCHRLEILDAFEVRLDNGRQEEFDRAIGEIHKIAAFRLADLMA